MALKNTDTKFNKAFHIICPRCQNQFNVCGSCYTGHKYCSDGCRDWGYRENRKKANKKHSLSLESKRDHCDRNRVYRQRVRDNQVAVKKSVMDKSSDQRPEEVEPLPAIEFCHICGKRIFFGTELFFENLELQLFDTD